MATIDLYCRLSKDDDGTRHSVDAQEAEGRAWCKANGHEVGIVRKDNHLSGWNPLVERPGFNEVMDRLESGASDGAWVRDLDRFTRKMIEAVRIAEVAKRGALIAAGRTSYNLNTSRGLKAFYDDAVDAEVEAQRISERTARGKRAKAARRKSNASRRGFARPGFLPTGPDWEPGDPRVPVPAERLAAEVQAVRDAVEDLLAGTATLAQIARRWNDAGLLTTNAKRWDGAMLRQMLVQPSMAGLLLVRPDPRHPEDEEYFVEVEDGPLDRATWDRLMLNFASRKRGRPATTYLLSGILRCGKCGSVMYGRPRTTRTREDGSVVREYWCQVRVKEQSGCGSLNIDQRFADGVVEGLTVERLGDPRHADRVARVAARVLDERTRLLAELSRLNSEVDSLLSKRPDAVWTQARIDARMEQYRPLVEDVQQQIAALEEAPEPGTAMVDAREAWDGATVAERRAMVKRAFPDGLVVKPAERRGRHAMKEQRLVPAA